MGLATIAKLIDFEERQLANMYQSSAQLTRQAGHVIADRRDITNRPQRAEI